MTVSIDRDAHEYPTSLLRTRADAETYVASVCFKHGPPRLLGIELEWTVHHPHQPAGPLAAEDLIAALGPHTPTSLAPGSPHEPLPNGSLLSVEPGGQVEISSLPTPSMRSLFDTVAGDAAHLRELCSAAGLVLGERGTDPWREPRRLLRLPRYAAMESAFDRIGSYGRLMMCSTAGIQVCLDVGESHRVAPRWAALHALGPVMIATFANSPALYGRDTGWASARTRSLMRTDPPRMRPGPIADDPERSWAERILDTALLCRRRDGEDWSAPSGISFADWLAGGLPTPPTRDDLDYHLTTVFPPVRPRGYFEVRYLDTQPGDDWMLPAAALIALFRSEPAVDKVLELTAPARGKWMHAARHGLSCPELARSARDIFDLACRCLQDCSDAPEGIAERLEATVQHKINRSGRAQR